MPKLWLYDEFPAFSDEERDKWIAKARKMYPPPYVIRTRKGGRYGDAKYHIRVYSQSGTMGHETVAPLP